MDRSFTEVPLTTSIGDVTLVVTSGTHAHIRADGPVNEPEFHKRETVIVRGVELTASLHLYRAEDGTWTSQNPDEPWPSTVYARRIHPTGNPNSRRAYDSTDPMRRSIREAFEVAMNEFARENPEVFEVAERQDAEREVAAAEDRVEKAEQALSLAQRDLREVRERYAAVLA